MEASGNSGAAVPPHAESGQRHAAHADLVSQMQAEVHRLSELALATIGELQVQAMVAACRHKRVRSYAHASPCPCMCHKCVHAHANDCTCYVMRLRAHACI
eukprot:236794-Chlamydomonas_euryale.AAC.8